MQTILTNARIVLEDEVIDGTLLLDEGRIAAIDQGRSAVATAIDCQGDWVAPGLIEMHTDNLEKHYIPRPGVVWPNALAAALAHDAQMAAAGVTTVYDALCVGYERGTKVSRAEIFNELLAAICTGVAEGVFRIDHRLHFRCELSGADLVPTLKPHLSNPLLGLASLMDHTPGQRQWRDLASLKTYTMGTSGMTEKEFEAHVDQRIATGSTNATANLPIVIAMFRNLGVPLATHDDTTVQHVEEGLAAGASISEFPTTLEAAAAAKERGLATVAGAPNVVRGGSHSGGVSVALLAERGVLDGLSSDYVPSSLLQAVVGLDAGHGIPLRDGIGMVTWRIADMLGIADRGRLAPGLRADVVQFRVLGSTPVVRASWCAGNRVL
ncbi:MAG: alpha-D-ribose 1-methylphosphonate 5-triphosphate diphosphatase [Hyphomicrobiaceae bacterium]|nr:alpha-D-ribose 1-methylphosphonate 5-triphosphate diphosphatase [Hyphomicrobiaceae bacterium]